MMRLVENTLSRLVMGALLMQISIVCQGETIYVDPKGSDQNPGTSSHPVKSLGKAIHLAEAYDVILIRSGQYKIKKTVKIFNKKNITIKADNNDAPQLKFTKANAYGILVGDDSSGIIIDGLSIAWASEYNGNVIGIAGKDISIRNNHIYFEKKQPVPKYDGIKILRSAENVLIEKNEINDAPQQCVDSVGGTGITVRNNLMYRCQNAVVLKGGSSHNLVESNTIIDMKYGAIGVGGFTGKKYIFKEYENLNTAVRDNFIYYSNDLNIGGGIFLRGAVSSDIYHNTIIGAGIHIKSGGSPENREFTSKNNRVHDNIIWTTGNDGIVVVDKHNDAGLLLDNNCYWKDKGSGEFKVNDAWYGYKDFIGKFEFDINSTFDDPDYGEYFRLPGYSPCSGKGSRTLPDGKISVLPHENN